VAIPPEFLAFHQIPLPVTETAALIDNSRAFFDSDIARDEKTASTLTLLLLGIFVSSVQVPVQRSVLLGI
jgi:hypothetical protein